MKATVAIFAICLSSLVASPKIHPDRSVTFSIKAPSAEEVMLTGEVVSKSTKMEREGEFWNITIGPLEPEIYSYRFVVDGVDVLDRENSSFKRWLTSDSLLHVPGIPEKPWDLQDIPHGSVHLLTYKSESLGGVQRPCRVYTPPGFEKSDHLPVSYLLHGYGDDEGAWYEVGKVHHIADHLIATGQMKPMLIVMPYGHALLSDETGDLFGRDRGNNNFDAMNKDIVEDLLPFIEKRYQCGASAEKRAIVGLSMGGGQSLGIGLRHSDLFGYVGGFSASIVSDDAERIFPAIAENPGIANERLKLLWFACGKEDFLIKRVEGFDHWLSDRGITHTYRKSDGGHEWKVWRHYLLEFLPLTFQ